MQFVFNIQYDEMSNPPANGRFAIEYLSTVISSGIALDVTHEKHAQKLLRLNINTNYLRIRKATLDHGFNNGGTQTNPVEVVLTGRVDKVEALLTTCGWGLSNTETAQKPFYHLLALAE